MRCLSPIPPFVALSPRLIAHSSPQRSRQPRSYLKFPCLRYCQKVCLEGRLKRRHALLSDRPDRPIGRLPRKGRDNRHTFCADESLKDSTTFGWSVENSCAQIPTSTAGSLANASCTSCIT